MYPPPFPPRTALLLLSTRCHLIPLIMACRITEEPTITPGPSVSSLRTAFGLQMMPIARSPLRHRYRRHLWSVPTSTNSQLKRGGALKILFYWNLLLSIMCQERCVRSSGLKLVEFLAWNERKSWSQHIRVYVIRLVRSSACYWPIRCEKCEFPIAVQMKYKFWFITIENM